jgi:outer membrane immunogenic protein
MRNLFLSSVALITFAGVANAADMPVKALKAAPPIDYLWNGFYLGGYYGDAVSQSSVKTPDPISVTNPGSHTGEMNVNDHNYTAGVTAGFNWKVSPNILIGVEGDLGFLGFDRTFFKEYNDITTVGEKADWYATARARVGYLTGPSLLYVTGGAAFVHTTDTFGGTVPPGAPLLASATSTSTRTGWTAGGGIETKLSRNWSAKTEYLYINTGTNTFVGNPFGVNANTTFSHNIHVFKSGVNYNFSGPGEGLSLFNAPMLASNHNWSGFYAGLNAGGGMSNFGVSGKQSPVLPGSTITGLNDINGSGFAGGVQAGYNYMITPRYFVGVEGDFGYLGMKQNLFDWFDTQDNFTMKTSWYGTARVRVGVSSGPALFYVTGGAAWVRLADGFAATVPPVFFVVPGDVSWTTRSGWTVGGGTEVALDAHWSAKIETLYIDTGIRSHNDTFPFAFFADFHERFAIARAGLNYKFGNDVVTARY